MFKKIKTLKRHSVSIFTLLLGILATIITFQQWQLQQLQIDLQQQRLEFSVDRNLASWRIKSIAEIERQLVEDFFSELFRYSQTHPDLSYYQAVQALVPMTATLPAQPFEARVVVRNNGRSTATKVRTTFDLDRPISNYAIDSLEPSMVRGKVGDQQLMIEIDRIVAGSMVTMTITSEGPASQIQTDRIVLNLSLNYAKSKSIVQVSFFPSDLSKGKSASGIELLPADELPILLYFPSQTPTLNVTVTSNEGPGTKTSGSSGTWIGF